MSRPTSPSTPQNAPKLLPEQNLSASSRQNQFTEFGIRTSEIGFGVREAETESDEYDIKVEPGDLAPPMHPEDPDLPEVKKETDEEDDWTANLQMDIKKEAVEDSSFVSC